MSRIFESVSILSKLDLVIFHYLRVPHPGISFPLWICKVRFIYKFKTAIGIEFVHNSRECPLRHSTSGVGVVSRSTSLTLFETSAERKYLIRAVRV